MLKMGKIFELMIIFLFIITFSVRAEQIQVTSGDANADGRINVQDVILIINVILGRQQASGNADCNGDGSVNVQDVICVINKILTEEVTSHYIPLTYSDFDPQAYSFKRIKVKDGLWIIFKSEYLSGPLYAMKISPSGHCLIPPFIIASTCGVSTNLSNNTFCILPETNGGFYLFTIEKSVSHSYLWYLKEYIFNQDGNKIYETSLMSFRSDKPSGLSALWADGRQKAVLSAVKDRTLYLYVKNENGFKEYEVVTNFLSKDHYKAFFDADSSKIIFVHISHDNAVFMRYNLSGECEVSKDITQALSEPNGIIDPHIMGWPEIIFKTTQGFVLPVPQYSHHPLFLLFLDEDGNVVKTVNVSGVNVGFYGDDKYDAILEGQLMHFVWAEGGGLYYTSFYLDGSVSHTPINIFHTLSPGMPFIAILNGHPFFIFQEDYKIYGFFIGYDFPSGRPDLVIAKPHIKQSPAPYAILGSNTKIKTYVFNRGEANSPQAQLKITYLDKDYTASVPVLQPGEKYLINLQLHQPDYLIDQPKLLLELNSQDWQQNNRVRTQIFFEPRTPIYPKNSQVYKWNLKDASDMHSIGYAKIIYELSGMRTVSGIFGDIKMALKSDSEGNFTTILPPGSYRFFIIKSGYPKTIYTFTVPTEDTSIMIEPPGDIVFSFTGSDGKPLHPSPQVVKVVLEHEEDSSLPDWSEYNYQSWGTYSGVSIYDLMPGLYQVHVYAFGYFPKDFQVLIAGGQRSERTVTLDPMPRGSIKGRIISSGEPVEGALLTIKGLSIETTSNNDGIFQIEDLPIDSQVSFVLKIRKQNFQAKDVIFHVSSEYEELGDIQLKKVYSNKFQIDKCRYAAWAQDVEWSIEDSYEIKNLYGVWQLGGALHYKQLQGSEELDIDQLDLEYIPFYWNYIDLDGHIVDAFFSWALGVAGEVSQIASYISDAWDAWDWGESAENAMITYDNLSDPLGSVQGGIVDCGEPDSLDLAQPDENTSNEDKTVIRIDDVRIYEDQQNGVLVKLFSSFDEGRFQYYSDEFQEGHLAIPIHLSRPVKGSDKLILRIYMRIMNGLYDSGPLALVDTDKIYLEWKVKNGKLVFNGLMPNPDDYPDFGD